MPPAIAKKASTAARIISEPRARLRDRVEETPCDCNAGRANRLSFAMLLRRNRARARRRGLQTLSYQKLRRNAARGKCWLTAVVERPRPARVDRELRQEPRYERFAFGSGAETGDGGPDGLEGNRGRQGAGTHV